MTPSLPTAGRGSVTRRAAINIVPLLVGDRYLGFLISLFFRRGEYAVWV